MAEVRLRLGRGAYNIAHISCSRYHHLATRSKKVKSATHASSLRSGDVKNRQVIGAAAAQRRVTGGVSPPDLQESEAEVPHYPGLNNEGSRLLTTDKKWTKKTFYTRRYRNTATPQEQLLFLRCFSCSGGRSEPLYRSKTGYYDILEVLPTASPAQIKTAYYKQSFIYHPDKNPGSEEATTRFSDVSEAYTVLGNKALRKKYDRGMLSQADLTGAARPSGTDVGTDTGSSTQPAGRSAWGADSNSDIDQFIKAHYSEQLQKQREGQVRREERLRRKSETIRGLNLGNLMEVAVVSLLAVALAIMINLKRGGN